MHNQMQREEVPFKKFQVNTTNKAKGFAVQNLDRVYPIGATDWVLGFDNPTHKRINRGLRGCKASIKLTKKKKKG